MVSIYSHNKVVTRRRKIILGIIVGVILLIVALLAIYILILQRTLSSLFSPNAAPITKENYQNPFAKPSPQYENPFSEYQNPFEELK